VRAWGPVEAGAANRQLDAVVARRLGEHPRLVGKDILVAGHTALTHLLHVHQVGATWGTAQALRCGLQVPLRLVGDQHLAKFDRAC